MKIEDRLARILRRSGCEYSVEDLLSKIAKREIIPFEYYGVLILVEVQQFPQKRVLHIWGAEGKGALVHMDKLVAWARALARSLECTELRCQGRAGWERALKKHGAVHVYTTLSMGAI